mmetsp:Transcript_17295/g.19348  ORF Transcript_17295/g.19348 Transcript_17295/m.19348 type:complete len:175 (+) Transcript_17295:34-558(+)|eukprot:CAMPEP_0205832344 /NCGR_PEP_ID=MMETSP0206-20130828/46694_1 /ASSEMBLY_ACC=CAM_ASM_000279 /TAXON_ID=36767 /ORGANISM="Euplotes focardii, Strain TN1" /LENGTH=174 /DNA_ID=CAMNT_0053137785 /DNA_START=31 /DNA_END=555 /DNA_ORIENTATION=-
MDDSADAPPGGAIGCGAADAGGSKVLVPEAKMSDESFGVETLIANARETKQVRQYLKECSTNHRRLAAERPRLWSSLLDQEASSAHQWMKPVRHREARIGQDFQASLPGPPPDIGPGVVKAGGTPRAHRTEHSASLLYSPALEATRAKHKRGAGSSSNPRPAQRANLGQDPQRG